MKKVFAPLFVFALLAGNVAALAHEEHCHVKGTDGKWTDAKDVKDEAACKEKGGVWKHHHKHCHKTVEGKHTDFDAAKNEKACKKAGGEWSDHGHEESEG